MKSDRAIKHLILAFVLAVGCYALFYNRIENRRTRKGPWEVSFSNSAMGAPTLVINQPKLAIRNVHITFPDQPAAPSNSLATVAFEQPKPVPFDVPFGKCIFMDTTFLPGTVTLEVFGHEIELLPRVLVIDRQERPWLSDSTIILHPVQPAHTQSATNPALPGGSSPRK
jgi:hypothetical protein